MKIVTIGGPKTGKSTYVIALYSLLVNRPPDGLSLVKTLGDVAFLNEGHAALANLTPVPRTDADVDQSTGVLVAGPNNTSIELAIPDRSGELLKGTLDSRSWNGVLRQDIESADALMLFISPLTLDPGASVEELAALKPSSKPDSNVAQDRSQEDPRPWRPALMPTDVRCVDLLQEIEQARSGGGLPIAVIVSAWDLVNHADWTPTSWVESRAPLLSQFLGTHQDVWPGDIFGISGQGGDFGDEKARAGLDDKDPWDRAFAVDSAGHPVSLASPVVGLLEPTP